MEYSVIVAGTGFDGRQGRIRMLVQEGMQVKLVPDPNNPHDSNAIAVYVTVRKWFTLFRNTDVQIGYIKKDRAKFFTKKINDGGKIINAYVKSMYLELDHPRVSLQVETDW